MIDTLETQLLEEAAAQVAAGLLERGVKAVVFTEVPHHLGGPPYYVGPECRLLVVVDDDTAERYLERCVKPQIVVSQDGAGAAITRSGDVIENLVFEDEREETRQQIVWHLLGINEELFLTALGDDLWFVWSDGDFDIVLVREGWIGDIDRFVELERQYFDDGPVCPLFTREEWLYAVEHHRVFDSTTNTFVPSRG